MCIYVNGLLNVVSKISHCEVSVFCENYGTVDVTGQTVVSEYRLMEKYLFLEDGLMIPHGTSYYVHVNSPMRVTTCSIQQMVLLHQDYWWEVMLY